MPATRLPSKLYGLVGHPAGHSWSPLLHTWAFSRAGWPGTYLKWDIPAQHFDAFMVAVRTLPVHGLSVTLPHKQRIIPYVDHLTPEALEIGAVNTLYWDEGQLWGTNTDCQGITGPLQARSVRPASAVILGAGGAALAAVVALKRLGCREIALYARDVSRARVNFQGTGVVCLPWDDRGHRLTCDLLINATPLGMAGRFQDLSPLPETADPGSISWVFDLIYTPIQTVLLQRAQAAGCGIISGLDMFVAQALGQYHTWTGLDFDPSDARELLVQAGTTHT